MGKFFNGRVKKDRTTLVRYIIIACGVFFIIFLFILIAIKNNDKKSNAVLIPKDSITIELNSDKPTITDLFEKIENYDTNLITIDYYNLNTAKIGEYEVKINAQGYNSATTKVFVKDTKAPELVLTELSINYGETYTADDFVLSCIDNSNEECIIDFYKNDQEQTGQFVDYSSFTDEGTYIIRIIAKDNSGNETNIKETKLIIGSGEKPNRVNPSECIYGDMTVSNKRYPMVVTVGDQNANCAIDRNLWDNKTVQEPAIKILNKDLEAIKKDENFKSYINTHFYKVDVNIVDHTSIIGIYNDDATGLVGYGIYVEIYASKRSDNTATDTEDNLILSYYINEDYSRKYIVNKCGLK